MSSAQGSAQTIDGSVEAPAEESQSRRGVARAASLLSLGNVASRVLGLVREMVISYYFGSTAVAAIFAAASRVPTTIYDLLVGGMLSSALVPVFSAYATRDDQQGFWRLASVVICAAAVILATLMVIVLLFAPQITLLFVSGWSPEMRAATTLMIRLIAPSIFFFGVSGVLTGLLYALKRFTFAAFAAAVFNLGIIIGVLFLSRAFEGNARIMGAALGLFLGSVMQLTLLLPDLRDAPLRPMLGAFWRNPGVRRIVKLYIPVALSVAVANAGVMIDYTLASNLELPNVLMWMRYGTTLIQFPLGLVAAAVSLAILPNLSRLSALENVDGYRRVLQMGVRMVLVLIIPATIGLFILAEPVITLIFERGQFVASDTYWTAVALRFYLLGLTFAAIDQLLIIAFYSRQDTWTPALVGIATVGVYLAVALPLVGSFGMIALVLANSVQHFAHAMIMLFLLHRRVGGLTGGNLRSAIFRILLASAGMGVVVWYASTLFQAPATFIDRTIAVLVPGAVGLASYGLLVVILRLEEAQDLSRLVWQRLFRRG